MLTQNRWDFDFFFNLFLIEEKLAQWIFFLDLELFSFFFFSSLSHAHLTLRVLWFSLFVVDPFYSWESLVDCALLFSSTSKDEGYCPPCLFHLAQQSGCRSCTPRGFSDLQ